MKVELNTDICPLIVPDTYGEGFQFEIADDCWDAFKAMMCDVAEDYIKDAIKDTRDFKGCNVTVSKELKSPRFYNYGTDWIDFTVEVSQDLISVLMDRVTDDFLKYIKRFGSRSGFISSYPTTEKEIERAFANPNSNAFALLISEFILYEFEKENDLDKYHEDYLADVWDKAGQNGYEIYEDDEDVEEGMLVPHMVDKILEGKSIDAVLTGALKEETKDAKYALMNKIIDWITKMSAEEFVLNYVDTEDVDAVADQVKKGFIPFTAHGKDFELSLKDGRLEYDGTSMGGSRDLYFKVKEIEKILKDKIA